MANFTHNCEDIIYKSVKSGKSISFIIPSDLFHLELATEECAQFVKELGVREPLTPVLVFHELLSNAICHGNKELQASVVIAKVEQVNDRQYTISMLDEGDGFEYENLDMEAPVDPRALKRRGFVRIRALSEHLEFNDKGNEVNVIVPAEWPEWN